MSSYFNQPSRAVALFHRRWTVPILAELHRDNGAKFVTLAHRLGVSRSVLTDTLDGAIEDGWVIRNPGYGHPLRPEYILTKQGRALGPGSLGLWTRMQQHELESVGLRKWSVPILLTLRDGPARFGQIRAQLHGATDRALSQGLQTLGGSSLIVRNPSDKTTTSWTYAPTSTAKDLIRPLSAA